MTMDVKSFRAQMKTMWQEQEERNRHCMILGERYRIPLEGRTLEMVQYISDPKAPVIFGIHGGGFSCGGCALDDHLWNLLHTKLDVTVLSLGYRRAPEYPFPAALYDIYDAIHYVKTHSRKYGIVSTDFSICGNSAGGNLATSVCMLDLKRGNQLKLKRQILNYPYCDLKTEPSRKGHLEEEQLMYQMYVEDYCRKEEVENPLVSPIFAKTSDLEGMPKAIVCLAEKDPLYREGKIYAEKLKKSGVETACFKASQMMHGYLEIFGWGMDAPESVEARKQFLDGSLEDQVEQSLQFIRKYF